MVVNVRQTLDAPLVKKYFLEILKGIIETNQDVNNLTTAARLDVTRATLEAFAQAASGGPAFPIPTSEMVHGVAVTEAIVRSAASGQWEKSG